MEETIQAAMKQAAVTGDIKLLDSLAQQMPQAFLQIQDRLLDDAENARQPSMVVHLILRHGCEVTPEFEKGTNAFGGDLFAEGMNEYKKTLEVLANAALQNRYPPVERSLACYDLRHIIENLAKSQDEAGVVKAVDQGKGLRLNPVFLEAARSGLLREFVNHKIEDKRFNMAGHQHFREMLDKLNLHEKELDKLALLPSDKTGPDPSPPHSRSR